MSFHRNSAFKPFPLHVATKAIRNFYVPVDKQVRSGASTAAIKAGPALLAIRSGIDVQFAESVGKIHIKGIFIEIAQLIFFIAHKLMTGINISFRRNGHIFAARPTAPKPLDHTRPLGQIHVEVEKVDVRTMEELLRQLFIFRQNARKILFPEGVVSIRAAHNGFHRNVS